MYFLRYQKQGCPRFHAFLLSFETCCEFGYEKNMLTQAWEIWHICKSSTDLQLYVSMRSCAFKKRVFASAGRLADKEDASGIAKCT